MVFISRHVLNNTLPSHVCVLLYTCDTRSVETTREIRDELDEIPLGGSVARL